MLRRPADTQSKMRLDTMIVQMTTAEQHIMMTNLNLEMMQMATAEQHIMMTTLASESRLTPVMP